MILRRETHGIRLFLVSLDVPEAPRHLGMDPTGGAGTAYLFIEKGRGSLWVKPLSSSLDLDETTHDLRSTADHAVGRLRADVERLPNRSMLVDPTRRHDIQSMLAFRRVVVFDRDIARVDLPDEKRPVPYDVAQYVRVMTEAISEVREIPVSEVLKRVARDLAGPGAGRVSGARGAVVDEDLPWRKTPRWFGAAAEDAYLHAPPPGPDLEARTEELFAWLDRRSQTAALTTLAAGMHQLFSIDPYTNTADLLHILATLVLVKAEKVPDQVVPMAVHLDRNRGRFRELHARTAQTADYNDMVRFFATGLTEQCENQLRVVDELRRLPERYHDAYSEKREPRLRRDGLSRVIDLLPSCQIVTSELLAEKCGFSPKRARELLMKVEELGFVELVETRRRTKIYEVKAIQRAIDLYGGMVPETDRDALRPTAPQAVLPPDGGSHTDVAEQ